MVVVSGDAQYVPGGCLESARKLPGSCLEAVQVEVLYSANSDKSTNH
jgi:hypothetical protein